MVFQLGQGEVDSCEESLFFVVGHINFSTWRFSLLHLELVEEHADRIVLQVPPRPNHHSVRTSAQFFAENITFSNAWKVQFWTILNDDAIVVESEMRADLVECQKDTELEAVVFWEGSEEEKRKRKKQVEPNKKKEKPKKERYCCTKTCRKQQAQEEGT